MDKEIVLGILGLLTAITGAIRWLLSVYAKQQNTIEDLRHKNELTTIRQIEDTIDDLRADINIHKKAMREMQTKIDHIYSRMVKTSEDSERVVNKLEVSVTDLMARIQTMESQVVQLAKGMMMIKSKVQKNESA